MTLATIPPPLDHLNMTHTEQLLDIHLSLSSILSNMFFMKMDWVTSRGLPCDAKRINQLYSRLVGSWQSLTCLFLRSVPVEDLVIISKEVEANLVGVVNTPINRYTNCQMRRTRDCVLLTQAQKALARLVIFYED